jgi:hypothetical protein
VPGGGLNTSTKYFPYACHQGNLSAQEKALEFMFFDLTACVTPDSAPPPAPKTTFISASFTLDYTAVCAPGTHVVWRELQWQATVPDSASIRFEAQSGPTLATLQPAPPVSPVLLSIATSSTPSGLTDAAYIDTGITGTGAFNNAKPVVLSEDALRIIVTLNPTTDASAAPTLSSWNVMYDCEPSE